MLRKKYVVCGVSTRAIHTYVKNICRNFKQSTELVGMLDIDPLRFSVCREVVPEVPENLPCYMPEDFDRMIAETKPDAVIVTSMDCTHAQYIIGALKHDLNVITEKPCVPTWKIAPGSWRRKNAPRAR